MRRIIYFLYICIFGDFFSVTVNKTPTECFTCYKRTQTLPVYLHGTLKWRIPEQYYTHLLWSLVSVYIIFSWFTREQFVVCHVSQWWKGKILCLIWDGGQQTKILCGLSPALGEGPMTTLCLPRQTCVTLSKWSSTNCAHEQKSIHKISRAFHEHFTNWCQPIQQPFSPWKQINRLTFVTKGIWDKGVREQSLKKVPPGHFKLSTLDLSCCYGYRQDEFLS